MSLNKGHQYIWIEAFNHAEHIQFGLYLSYLLQLKVGDAQQLLSTNAIKNQEDQGGSAVWEGAIKEEQDSGGTCSIAEGRH